MSALASQAATVTPVATSTTVVTLLAASGSRRMAMVHNDSAGVRHQQLTPITSDANKRATGVGVDVRISATPLTGTVTLPFFSIYMFGA